MYDLAFELNIADINQVLDLPLEVYRGWIIWMDRRKKQLKRAQHA